MRGRRLYLHESDVVMEFSPISSSKTAVLGANSLGQHEVRIDPAVHFILQLVEDPGV